MSEKVDVSKLREGDVVTLKGIVVPNPHEGAGICVRPIGSFSPVNAANLDIVSVDPRPLKVGDKVRTIYENLATFSVIAIDGEHAWLKGAGGRGFLAFLVDVRAV